MAQTKFICFFWFFLIPFITYSQDVSIEIQVGDSQETYATLGSCFLANSYSASQNLPDGISVFIESISKNNFGYVYAGFTVNVDLNTAPGTYTGELYFDIFQFSGSLCFRDTVLLEIIVIPTKPPVTEFSTFPLKVTENANVQFENKTENPVTEWLWEFGDGAESTEENPSHKYVSAGKYTVSLTATGPGGSKKEQKERYIEVVKAGTAGITKWNFSTATDNYITRAPAIAKDGTIILSSADRKLYAVNPDGTEKWSASITIRNPFIGPSGTIYGSIAHILKAINPDGSLKWEFTELENGETIDKHIAIGLDETIYITTLRGKLLAIAPNGKELWRFSLPDVIEFKSPVIATDGSIYCIGEGESRYDEIFRITPQGKLKWRTAFYNQFGRQLGSLEELSITRKGNIVGVGLLNAALDPDGNILWQRRSGIQPNFNSQIVFNAEGNIIGSTDFKRVFSLDISTGDILWELNLEDYLPCCRNNLSPPVIGADGTIYLYTKLGIAFAISPEGQLLWHLDLVPEDFEPNVYVFEGFPTMDSSGTLLIGYDDATLHAINTDSPGPLQDNWSQYGQNPQNTRSYQCPFPVLNSPLDSAIDQKTKLNLEWTNVFLANAYEVEVSTTPDFLNLVTSKQVTSTTIPLEDLDYGSYYWRVRPVMEEPHSGCWSVSRIFSTVGPPPEQPILNYPMNEETGIPLDLSFNWQPDPLADSYRLQIATDPSFMQILLDSDTLTKPQFPTMLPQQDQQYYWRVRASNSTGNSPWSQKWSFTTVRALPSQPNLSLPEDGATNVPLEVSFKWGQTDNADSYRLQLAADQQFTSLIEEQENIKGTSTTISVSSYLTNYFWRVQAVNTAGPGDWSIIRSFTTIQAAPDQAVLTAPTDGATGIPLNITLKWQPLPGADSYQLQMADDGTFTDILLDQVMIQEDALNVMLPDFATAYFWRVRGVNSTGNGPWSQKWSFTTVRALPSQPKLSLPEDGATNVPLEVSFKWGQTDNADSYRFQLAADKQFNSPIEDVENINRTSVTISVPAHQTTYFWRIQAVNTAGSSDWSTIRSFTTLQAAPEQAVLTAPANGATGIPLDITLRWQSLPGADSYQLQIADDGTFTDILLDQVVVQEDALKVRLPNFATAYFWRVRGVNSTGNGPWSQKWSFTTVRALPSQPKLTLPENGAVNVPLEVSFKWRRANNADSYRLQLAADKQFTSLIEELKNINGTATSISVPNHLTTYYWRVQAVNTSGAGDWSSIRSFTTIQAAPDQVVLTIPANGTIGIPLDFTLRWQPLPGADSYQVQISGDRNFSDLLVNQVMVQDDSLEVILPDSATVYFWRVRGVNSTGNGSWSAVWKFETIEATVTSTSKHFFHLSSIIYPNPAQARLTLEFNSPEYFTAGLAIYNESGQRVAYRIVFVQANMNQIRIDLEGMPAGHYTYRLYGKKYQLSGRLMIIR